MSTIGSSTSTVSQSLFAKSDGTTSNFLTSTDKSPVQKMLDAQKSSVTQTEKGSYFYSEDYLRLQAYEIKSRITTYKNLGMTSQYSQAQQEGQVVVGAYQAYTKAAGGKDDAASKAAGVAAAKAYMQGAQQQSFSVTPSILIGA